MPPHSRAWRVYEWRRMLLHVLFKWDLMVRLSALVASHIDLGSLLSMAAFSGVTVKRRPKDPNMPGLSRLKRPELMRLAEAYHLDVVAGVTVEELRNMLYDAEPIMGEAAYQARGNERHKTDKAAKKETTEKATKKETKGARLAPAASSSGPAASSSRPSGTTAWFQVDTSSEEEGFSVIAGSFRRFILDDWPRVDVEPTCECGRGMTRRIIDGRDTNPFFACHGFCSGKCFKTCSYEEVYGADVVEQMRAKAEIAHDRRTA